MAPKIIEVKSPCINNCFTDTDTGLCKGCYRTQMEKCKWRDMSPLDKLDTCILANLRKEEHGELKSAVSLHYAPMGR